MALHHLLFRCPQCGHDPLVGERDRASCPDCGCRFERARKGGDILVTPRNGGPTEARIEVLIERIEEHGGALGTDTGSNGSITREADVIMQVSGSEEPLHYGGAVLGFVEHLSEGERGVLRLLDDCLVFEPSSGDAAGDARGDGVAPTAPTKWALVDLRALQSASSSVQISPAGGGMVQFKFVTDSPVRWEALLKGALQRAYSLAGRGKIREFQPRIVSG